ncbi:hypothetical protein AMTR_s00072p00021800 [Amborella trichopoda]|uniref:Uncharacterized protein n=1 Tax=Amborella trichopoda TaxID=13333 RepID=W1NP91_AMBTC|nr:hypothetical protein AMTR_s00072p00021800 [Amborella trichopoda]
MVVDDYSCVGESNHLSLEEENRREKVINKLCELERRLHELLHTRQQERITELENALECSERRLLEKEIEVITEMIIVG